CRRNRESGRGASRRHRSSKFSPPLLSIRTMLVRRISMITLYGFGTIFREGYGETKDLWAQWVLEETGLPYRVHALDHTGGETKGEAFGKISPFRQAPVIDDDGMIVAESA